MEKTLKGIHPLTICTVLVFPVVVALLWTMYNGVGGSVVPATPSGSSIRVFTIKLRVVAPPEWKYSRICMDVCPVHSSRWRCSP